MADNELKNEMYDNFTQVSNMIMRCKDISLKAKGLYTLILGYASGWEFNIPHIVSMSKDGKSAVRSGIEELEDNGLLEREQVRDENGQFHKNIWILKSPKASGIEPVDSGVRYTVAGKPADGKSDPKNISTKNISTKNKNKNISTPPLDSSKSNTRATYDPMGGASKGCGVGIDGVSEEAGDDRLDVMQLQALWRNTVGYTLKVGTDPELREEAVAICDMFGRRTIEECVKYASDRHACSWDHFKLRLRCLAKDTEVMPEKFIAKWEEHLDREWLDKNVRRLRWLCEEFTEAELADAVLKTRQADDPSWKYFETVITSQ